MPTCPQCGKPIEPTWKFCLSCGKPIPTLPGPPVIRPPEPGEAAPPPGAPAPGSLEGPRWQGGTAARPPARAPLVVALIVLAVAAGGVFLFVAKGAAPDASQPAATATTPTTVVVAPQSGGLVDRTFAGVRSELAAAGDELRREVAAELAAAGTEPQADPSDNAATAPRAASSRAQDAADAEFPPVEAPLEGPAATTADPDAPTRSRDGIAAAMGRGRARFRSCHEEALRTDPRAVGMLTVRFTIAADGRVESAEAGTGAGAFPPSMIDCLLGVVREMVFVAADEPTTVSYPFNFASQ